MEVEEGLERVNVGMKVCNAFQDCFFQYKKKLQSYLVEDNCCIPTWNFDSILVFAKLQNFLQHIKNIQVM